MEKPPPAPPATAGHRAPPEAAATPQTDASPPPLPLKSLHKQWTGHLLMIHRSNLNYGLSHHIVFHMRSLKGSADRASPGTARNMQWLTTCQTWLEGPLHNWKTMLELHKPFATIPGLEGHGFAKKHPLCGTKGIKPLEQNTSPRSGTATE